MAELAALTWPEVAGRAAGSLLAVPVGSTEQHGPHLPLCTDTEIALELCRRLASARRDVLVAPAVPYGSSGEHAGFAGTLSIGGPVLESVLVELGRSADAFAGIVFVSAHGGNTGPLRRAASLLRSESRRARVWALPAPPGARADAHAGHTETSVLLTMAPAAVRLGAAEAGPTAPLAELMPALATAGVAAVSPNGVLGDPAGASAEDGRRILDGWAARLVADLEGWP